MIAIHEQLVRQHVADLLADARATGSRRSRRSGWDR